MNSHKIPSVILLPSPLFVDLAPLNQAVPQRFQLLEEETLPLRLRQATGLRLPLVKADESMPLLITIDPNRKPQSYRLVIKQDQIHILAGEEMGAWWAVQTLWQLCHQPDKAWFFGVVEDEPEIARRGVMLDISRDKVPTLTTLYRLVDLLSVCKINQFQLYTEHTFAYPGHEIVWGDASPMTAEDVRLLDAYCRDRYVELVPNQNSFGHFERWLRHPEYHYLAEAPGGFSYPWGGRSPYGTTLRPHPESLRFLESLYDNLFPHFSSGLCNIGCDETWDLGQGWSRERCEKEGKHQVYLDFLRQIIALVEKRGKRVMFWADILLEDPQTVRQLPEGTIGLVWGYEADHPFAEQCQKFREAGIPYYVCPGTSSWNSIGGRWENCLLNLRNAAANGAEGRADGYLINDWGDGGHHQFLPISYLGFLAGAGLAWNSRGFCEDTLRESLNLFVWGDTTGVLAEVLLRLGKVRNFFQRPTTNRHPLNTILFLRTEALDQGLKLVTEQELLKALEELAEIDRKLSSYSPNDGECQLVRSELLVATGFLRHAASRALHHLQGRYARSAELRRELIPLIGRYEECWLARNRPGGLYDSSARLRQVLASY